MAPRFAAVFRALERDVLAAVEADPSNADSIITYLVLNAQTHAEFEALYFDLFARVGADFAEGQADALAQQTGITPPPTASSDATTRTLHYATRYTSQRVTDLLHATARRLLSEVEAARSPSATAKLWARKDAPVLTLDALTGALTKAFDGLATDGADFLAEKEVVLAGNQGMFFGAASLGIELDKVWQAVMDNRTRPWHADANGQQVPMDAPFDINGEFLMFPMDWSMGASGSNIYNCRCVAWFTLPSLSKALPVSSQLVEYKAEWDETAHPRDERGRFAGGGAGDGWGGEEESGGVLTPPHAGPTAYQYHDRAVEAAARANYADAAAPLYRPKGYDQRWDIHGSTFYDAKDAEGFLNTFHPATNWDLSGFDTERANDFAHEADALWDKHPGAGATVQAVYMRKMGEGTFAATSTQYDQAAISLNDRYFAPGTLPALRTVAATVPDTWWPKGGAPDDVQFTIAHEFGHVYQAWASNHGKITYSTSDWDEHDQGVSGYGSQAVAAGDTGEQFADAFALAALGIPSDNEYVQIVGRMAEGATS